MTDGIKNSDSNRVAAIIVNFKQDEYLPRLIDSLDRQSRRVDQRIIINNSLSKIPSFEGCHALTNDRNVGYPAAINQGIRMAIDLGCDGFFILNSDIALHENCLERLLGADADIVQPAIFLMRRPQRLNCTGLMPTRLGIARCMNYMKRRPSRCFGEESIPAASGAAFLVHKRVIDRIGLLDEGYFMYLEDVEYSLRAREAGFRIAVSWDAIAWHDYSFLHGVRKIWCLISNSRRIRQRYGHMLRGGLGI